ncbi:M20 family metallopeptidase [Clostridium culturomicium]|uniref:M20 family metallopeptidase n=1 Tax=Clostridium culturomicium TaxID=1499683 RepID=UPI000A633C8C|nr:M20 family metallopeptidase [Clostridium culturomicium]
MSIKERIIEVIDSNKDRFIEISHLIHEKPEVGNKEFFASNLLIKELENHGFYVETNIAGHETGFIATKKASKEGATIGYLAEYDALPGLGHGCGHNIIGASSIAAAIALGEVIEQCGGTVKVFGTPAEEGGENGSAKGSFVKAGVFEGVTAAMMVHPGSYTQRTGKSLAVAPIDFEFFGKPAHASGCPEEGINALDAMLLFYNGINALRQQVTSDVRIHGVILNGGEAPNIIPEYTRARFYLRAATREALEVLTHRIINIAQGSAISTGCTTSHTYIQNIVENLVPNVALDNIFEECIEDLGEMVERSIKKSVGSTDTGNVSHVVPTIHPTISICDEEIPAHTVEFREAACSTKGDKGLILAAKALALTGLKVIEDPDIVR